MFYGEYCHAIDKKGRIIIPAKFREILKKLNRNNFVVTRGLEKSLFIFSHGEWELQAEKFKSLSLNEAAPRAFKRILFSSAYRCSLDKQGRINLPQTLIRYANIKREVVIVGVYNRIEIWDKVRWKDYVNKSEYSFGKIAEKFVEERNLGVIKSE